MKKRKLFTLLTAVTLVLSACAPGASPEETTAPAATVSQTEMPTQPPTEPPTEPTTEPTTEPPTQGQPEISREDFSFEGVFPAYRNGTCVPGIDVSSHQGEIDWQAVKAAGVEFVMIRVGFRGYGKTGSLNPDQMAQENYRQAKAAGLKIGAYFFSQALTPEEAVEEAGLALELTKAWEMELPLAYDWEYISEEARTAGMTAEEVTACAAAFCEAVRQGGRTPMVYASLGQDWLLPEKLEDIFLWTADLPARAVLWQFSRELEIPGISGPVDGNVWLP